MQSSSTAPKDKVPILKLTKCQDSARFCEVKSQIFNNICSSERNLLVKKTGPPTKSSEFQVRLKPTTQDKRTTSIYSHVEDIERELSETTLNILNTTASNSNNVFIEENFPRVLHDLEKSVTLLKKFYADLCQKKHLKTVPGHPTHINNIAATSLTHQEDTRLLPRVDIDVIQNEYEKVYHRKTKDLQTLYEFYTHEFLNGSFKSTNASGITPKTNSNSSLSSHTYYQSVAADNYALASQTLCFDSTGKNDVHNNNKPSNRQTVTQENEQRTSEAAAIDPSKPALALIRPLKLSGVSNPKILTHKERLEQITNITNRALFPRGKSLGSLADLIGNTKLPNYKENKDHLLTERTRELKAKTNAFDVKEVIELTQKPVKKPTMSINLQNLNNINKEPTPKKAKGKKPLSARNYVDKENDPKHEKNVKRESEKTQKGKEEVFSKIFAKNMLINKLKQDINENLQKITKSKKGSNIENIAPAEMKLNGKQQATPDWIDNKRLKAIDLNEGVIENGSENASEKNSENSIRTKDQQNIVTDNLETINEKNSQESNQAPTSEHALNLLTQQLPLSSSDMKVINELKTISNMLNQNEVLHMIQNDESSATTFQSLQKKVKMYEEFKKHKYFVPEIPKRKLQVCDSQKLNQEEDLRHKKELADYYTNRQIISELENILDESHSALDMNNNDQNQNLCVDDQEFFGGLKGCDQEKDGEDLSNLSLDLKD